MDTTESFIQNKEREDIRQVHWLYSKIANNINATQDEKNKLIIRDEALDDYDMLVTYLITRYLHVFSKQDQENILKFRVFLDSDDWKNTTLKKTFKEFSDYHNDFARLMQVYNIDKIITKIAPPIHLHPE